MSHEIYPELGEKFAVVGKVELMEAAGDLRQSASLNTISDNLQKNLKKGFLKTLTGSMIDAQIRKGTFVITDRRVAFKGGTSYFDTAGLITHALGAGTRDLSISYPNIYVIEKCTWPKNFHLRIGFFDEDSREEKHIIIKILQWGTAVPELIQFADKGIDILDNAGVLDEGLSLVPIAGDFLSIGSGIGHWLGGMTAAPQWIALVQNLKKTYENKPAPVKKDPPHGKTTSPVSRTITREYAPPRQPYEPTPKPYQNPKKYSPEPAVRSHPAAAPVPASRAMGSSGSVNNFQPAYPTTFRPEDVNPDDIIIRSVECISPRPVACVPVEYLVTLGNDSASYYEVLMAPLVRHHDQSEVETEPIRVTVPSGKNISVPFQFTPLKKGDYDIAVSTEISGIPGPSYLCLPLHIEGTSFEVRSVAFSSDSLSPGEETKIFVSVNNTGSGEIPVDTSAVTCQNGLAISETYIGSLVVQSYMIQAIGGTITVPETEGVYSLKVIARSGTEERTHTLDFSVKTAISALILDPPGRLSAGERFVIHVEVANPRRARTLTVIVIGNGIDEVARQVSIGANERKIIPVDVMASKTIEKSGEMDIRVQLRGDMSK